MKRTRAMTLIELLCVLAVIATLAAILFPVFARAREAARKQTCLSNLVNIGFALQMYAQDHAGRFPPTEDDLSPLLDRYLRADKVFLCPSNSDVLDILPMGAPANPKLYQPPRPTHGHPALPEPGGAVPPAFILPKVPLPMGYYYRAGRRPDEAPSRPLLSDQKLVHNDRANVLYTDGHAAVLAEPAWRALGFKPLEEVWPPEPYRDRSAPGTGMMPGGMPGMGGPGPPGGPPRGSP